MRPPALLPAILLVALATPALARSQAVGGDQSTLHERGRELMHPSDAPTTVVGLEQGDNGFRDRTPGLLQSERATVLIDADENHRRRMAMYTGHVYDRPPRSSARVPVEDGSEARARSEHAAAEGPAPAGSGGHGTALLAGAVALLLAGLGVSRLLRRAS